MHTAYLPEITGSEKHIQISNPKEVHHMARVLRLSVGECIGIINGVGGAGKARIVSISAQGPISLELTEFDTRGVLQPKLHLYCAVPKHGRWENILEKGTEIGVTSITPLMTQNSDVIWSAQDWKKKEKRHLAILESSAKQCASPFMPQLFPPVEFSVYVEKEKKEPSKIFMGGLTDNVVPLKKALGHIHVKDTLDFLIGPEGDFSEKEYIQAKENSWHVVSLGSQVLRVDTAVISAISFIRQFYLD